MTTVVVTLCDENYYEKAKMTIRDVRSRGEWMGDIVMITVGFSLDDNFRDFYRLTEKQFQRIDTTGLISQIRYPFHGGDGREFTKLVQWEKLHVFDSFFMGWDRVVFLDAGLRILDPLTHFLGLEYSGKILAHHDNGPLDAPRRGQKPFTVQLCIRDPDIGQKLVQEFGPEIMTSTDYFLNCFWIYDTRILQKFTKQDMIHVMNRYPIWKSNEMGVMNAFLHFRHHLWEPLPFRHASSGKILFEWSESTQDPIGTWRDFCALKYPITLKPNDT